MMWPDTRLLDLFEAAAPGRQRVEDLVPLLLDGRCALREEVLLQLEG